MSRRTLEYNPRSRPRPHTFYPPRDRRICHALLRLLLPLALRHQMKISRVEIAESDLERLRALRAQRCLLLPSHCGGFEPHILLHLARRLGEKFHYLAAIETFERAPLNAWFMQGIGAYSIIRGAADRPSFMTTKRILVEGQRRLVIFPEGHTVWQNDTLIPFQQGVLQLAFKAYEEAAERQPDASLYCVPLAIKYVYEADMTAQIHAGLDRLEAALFAQPPQPAEPYERLRRAGEAILTANERKHDAAPPAGASFDERIQRMKERVTARIEAQLGAKPLAGQPLLERIRALFHLVDQIVQEDPAPSRYERRLQAERQQAARVLYDDLWRMLQFVAIYDGYVRETGTIERFLDMLGLLEMEVFDRRTFRGPRKALVAVGAPINLKDRAAAYRANKRGEAAAVTLALESSVREMLAALGRLGAATGLA